MPNYFPIGWVLLGILLVLMLFGATQKIFDKLKISTLWAIIITVAVGACVLIPNIRVTNRFYFNIGGFLIPFILCLYMVFRIGWSWDMLRAWISAIVTGGLVLLMYWVVPTNTVTMRLVAAIIVGLIAGAVSYLFGRSRRGAFFSAIMGIYLGETARFLINYFYRGIDTTLTLGAGTMFDSVIIAAFTATLLAIAIGEIRERMVTQARSRRKFSYEAGEFYENDTRNDYHNPYDAHYDNIGEMEDPKDDFFRDD